MLRLFPTASGDLRGAPAAVTNLSVSVDSATRTLTGGPRRLDGESDLRIAIDSLRSLEGAPDYVGGSMEIYFDNINEKKYKGPDFLAGTPLRIGEDFNATFVFAPFEPGERILPAGRELRAGGAVNFITSDDAYVGGKGKKRDVMTFDYNGWTDSLSIVDDNKKYGYRYDEELSPAEKKIYDTAVDGIDAWSIAICIAKPAGIQKMMSDGVDTIPGDSVDHGEYRTKQ